MIPPK